MSSPRLALIPLALLSLATAAPVAGAANRGTVKLGCSTADAKGFVYAVKPKTCLGYDARTDASTTFTASKLKWKSWGASKATATGSLATAAIGGKAKVTASKLKKCSSKLSIYTRVEFVAADYGTPIATLKVPCPGKD